MRFLADESCDFYLRFPATARQAMTDAVLRLVEREGARLNRRFVVVQPGRIRITELVIRD